MRRLQRCPRLLFHAGRAWICGDVPASVLPRRMRTSTLSPWLCCAAVRGFALRGLFGLGRPGHGWRSFRGCPADGNAGSPGARPLAAMLSCLVLRRGCGSRHWPLGFGARFCVKGSLWLGPTSDMDGAHSEAVLRTATPGTRVPGRLQRCSRVLSCAEDADLGAFPLGFAARRCEALR